MSTASLTSRTLRVFSLVYLGLALHSFFSPESALRLILTDAVLERAMKEPLVTAFFHPLSAAAFLVFGITFGYAASFKSEGDKVKVMRGGFVFHAFLTAIYLYHWQYATGLCRPDRLLLFLPFWLALTGVSLHFALQSSREDGDHADDAADGVARSASPPKAQAPASADGSAAPRGRSRKTSLSAAESPVRRGRPPKKTS